MDMHFFRASLPQTVTVNRFPKRIERLSFSLVSSGSLLRVSELQVNEPIFYAAGSVAQANGVLDRRLGISTREGRCETCGRDVQTCVGHFGHIKLTLPVFHPALLPDIRNFLSMVCHHCSRVKLSATDRARYRGLTREIVPNLLKAAQATAREMSPCPFCGMESGKFNRIQGFRLIHELDPEETDLEALQSAVKSINAGPVDFKKVAIDPILAQNIFSRIPECDYPFLGIRWTTPIPSSETTTSAIDRLYAQAKVTQPVYTNVDRIRAFCQTRPEDLIMTHVPVPPNCIRPSVMSTSKDLINEDTLTTQLAKIVKNNITLQHYLESGMVESSKLCSLWDELYSEISLMITGSVSGRQEHIKGIIDRLKGKTGRFRNNLSGKRVDFSGRSVISPNPYLSIQQVAVPRLIAQNLTFPEVVTQYNVEFMRELVQNGSVYPGANEVLQLGDAIRNSPLLKRIGLDIKQTNINPDKAIEAVAQCLDTFNLNVVRADMPELHAAIRQLVASESGSRNKRIEADAGTETKAGENEDDALKLQLNSSATLQLMNITSNDTLRLNKKALALLDAEARGRIAHALRPGDIVYRHLLPNDTVLFNRQPSLHRMSIMQFNAVVHENRTFSFNPINCTPFNADFDGDEMNLFYLQTQEARAEASVLMAAKNNIVSPRHGNNIIGLTQDFLTGLYVLSGKDIFLKWADFTQLLCYGLDGFGDATFGSSLYKYGRRFLTAITNVKNHDDSQDVIGFVSDPIIHQPAIVYPRLFYTGKQVLSTLLRGNRHDEMTVTIHTPDKTYDKDDKLGPLSIRDDFLVVINSELISGRLTKNLLSSSRSSIFYFLVQTYGPVPTSRVMLRFAKVGARFLMIQGFTIGMDDVMPSEQVLWRKGEIIQEGYAHAQERILQYERGELVSVPGATVQATLEAKLNQILSNVREGCAKVALQELHFTNKPLIMSLCGSKGSPINIAQMVVILGQQSFGGSRAPDDFHTRTAPYFYHFSKDSEAKGFITNSFYTGLTPFEFIAHARAGRDGVIDSACKTAETGYLQRRLVKCLEDLSIGYDGTVRNSHKTVVEFRFGYDSLDPTRIETNDGLCIDLAGILRHTIVRNRQLQFDASGGADIQLLSPEQARLEVERCLGTPYFGREASRIETSSVLTFFDRTVLPSLREHKGPLASSMLSSTITARDIEEFMRTVRQKYMLLELEPGTPCGAVAAQSVGEPSTQMTLKAFHHAGLASMNITQGVPRLKEIINGVALISTPIITAYLDLSSFSDTEVTSHSLEKAKMMKNIIECTLLGHVAQSIVEVYDELQCFIEVTLDTKTIANMGLSNVITLRGVQRAIQQFIKPKPVGGSLRDDNCFRIAGSGLRVYPPTQARDKHLFSIQTLKLLLPQVPVAGILSCSRAVLNEYKPTPHSPAQYNLLIEGTGLMSVFGISGIDFATTTTNNVIEVAKTLGIEAAVAVIVSEIRACMDSHGMAVDIRHIRLLADVMCFKGRVLGITRFGLTGMKADSVLMLASFEKTAEHLFNAAIGNKIDEASGVSESIIMGKGIGMGTGAFSLLRAPLRNRRTGSPKHYVPKPRTAFLGDDLDRSWDEVRTVVDRFWYDETQLGTGEQIRTRRAEMIRRGGRGRGR
ncbi:DNA-directed RNA polymerase subunit A [Giardia muris]|uniref:DNA-directed RNA polymerase subunit n=1 Tax=Giardia muris TaxID=5742 RepID=A0A4Z1T157_GIAMU|nr:DNA-directed RNA polymerase subunit A [Giardia muris]|eukprot:TNJ30705.1 DNA-directed RNA polymerase subunit A [Giardia muris]